MTNDTHYVELVIGKRGVGKSTNIIKGLRESNKKALIFDINNEFNDIDAIKPDKVKKFATSKKNKVVRVVATNDLTLNKIPKFLENIIDDLRGFDGTLVIEEPNKIFTENNNNLFGLISCNRTHKMNVILTYRSSNTIPNRVLMNASFMRLYKSNDDMSIMKEKMPDNWMLLHVCQKAVNNSWIDDYHYIDVDLNNNSIIDFNL